MESFKGQYIFSRFYEMAKKYSDKTFSGQIEIASFLGNVAMMGKDIVVHAHGVFADHSFKAYAGHVKKMIVSATCEVVFHILPGKIERIYDKYTGLNLTSI